MPRLVSSPTWACRRIRADGEAGVHSLSISGFNLSRLKVLRSLEVGTWITDFIPAHHAIVTEVFSMITPRVLRARYHRSGQRGGLFALGVPVV
jgi:hypothetical protein